MRSNRSGPTTMVTSGWGLRDPSGAATARNAISTSVSARRWAGVRASSWTPSGSRPRRWRASAQSASNSWRSMRSKAPKNVVPEIGSSQPSSAQDPPRVFEAWNRRDSGRSR
jgi:hypothetical protein